MFENQLKKYLKQTQASPLYLDANLNGQFSRMPGVTAIVPTRNRAPNPVKQNSNPLAWCLESLLSQKKGGLNEIMVIDDASTDYTSEVVNHFAQQSHIPIIYLKNETQLGSSISRNKAVEASKSDLIMFLDDDCVFSRYMVFGANQALRELGREFSAIHLPVYHRKTIPKLEKQKNVGVLDLQHGIMTGNYDGFPEEYLENIKNNLLHPNLKIVNPFEIKNLGGIFLARKQDFQEIGGFPEFFTWTNGYREETHVALRFTLARKKIAFTPDPKFYCVHLKYGAKSKTRLNKNPEHPNLKEKIEMSNIQRVNTGNRVEKNQWFNDYITSTHFTFACASSEAAETFKKRMEKEFVEKNTLAMTGVKLKINSKETRRKIFQEAIKESQRLLKTVS